MAYKPFLTYTKQNVSTSQTIMVDIHSIWVTYKRLIVHPPYTYAPGTNTSQSLNVQSKQPKIKQNMHVMLYPTNNSPRSSQFYSSE